MVALFDGDADELCCDDDFASLQVAVPIRRRSLNHVLIHRTFTPISACSACWKSLEIVSSFAECASSFLSVWNTGKVNDRGSLFHNKAV